MAEGEHYMAILDFKESMTFESDDLNPSSKSQHWGAASSRFSGFSLPWMEEGIRLPWSFLGPQILDVHPVNYFF